MMEQYNAAPCLTQTSDRRLAIDVAGKATNRSDTLPHLNSSPYATSLSSASNVIPTCLYLIGSTSSSVCREL
jgi:hypothetical protein